MTARTSVEPQREASAKTAYCKMAVESERRRVTMMSNGKTSECDDRAGRRIGMSGKAMRRDSVNKSSKLARRAAEGDIWASA
jgi:hypothetical protein